MVSKFITVVTIAMILIHKLSTLRRQDKITIKGSAGEAIDLDTNLRGGLAKGWHNEWGNTRQVFFGGAHLGQQLSLFIQDTKRGRKGIRVEVRLRVAKDGGH